MKEERNIQYEIRYIINYNDDEFVRTIMEDK